MTALPPDQLQAIQAILAQQAPAQAEQIAQSIAVTVQTSPIDTNAIARALLIDGTATQTNALDQLLIRTGQGDFLVRLPQAVIQQLQDNLPSRVTLQLRPGPNGLEAILVVGSRAAQQADQVQQSLASNAAASRQTLTSEIPKIGQVFQVTVLPSTLLPNLLNNPYRSNNQKTVQNAAGQTVQVAEDGRTTHIIGQADANNPGGPNRGAGSSSANPAPLKTNEGPINNVNAGTAGSRNNYDPNSTQGNAQQGQGKLPAPTGEETVKIPLPINQTSRPQLLPIRILNVETPQSEVPLNDKALIATVRGATTSGQPILTIDDQVVVVNANKNWPIGTKLQVALGAGAELVIDREPKSAPTVFENLRQILEFVGQQNPVLLNDVKRFRVPQGATGQVAGPLLFFLAAMQKGNINAWLGDDLKEALETNGKHALLTALKNEIDDGRMSATDNMGTSWKGTTVPYLDGDKLQQFRFYVHDDPRHKQQEGQASRDIARRFLIDVSLTRLGPIQLDGLVNKKKLDLIVRTVNTLPEELRNDLRLRFAHAMEEVRYMGSLIFQTNKQGWVEIKARQGQSLSRNM